MNHRLPPYPPVQPAPGGLAADYLERDPITGRMYIKNLGYFLEQQRITAERSSETARQIAAMVPHTVRPLQGLQPNQRGQAILFEPGDLSARTNFRVDPKGDDSEILAISLGLEPVEEEPDGGVNDAFFQANIEWGTGGSTYSATVDILRGTVVHVDANLVTVSAFRLPPLDDSTPILGKYAVRASAAYYGIGRSSNPARFTDRLGILGAGLTARSVVPNFATAFTVLSGAGAIHGAVTFQPLRADVLSSAAGIDFNTFEVTTGANIGFQSENQFPLHNASRFVDITNLGNASTFVQVVYSLAL